MCHIPVLGFVLLFSVVCVVFHPDRPGAIVVLYSTWTVLVLQQGCIILGLFFILQCCVRGDLGRLLGILLRTFVFLALKLLKMIRLAKLLVLRVPDEDYSRSASCVINLISTFLLKQFLFIITPNYMSRDVQD